MRASDPYLARFEDTFEREGASRGPAWLYPIRKAGISRFAEIGLPTPQQEDWRFTNVAPIGRLPFKPLLTPTETSIKPEQFHFGKLPSSRLVFINGHYAPRLSTILPQESGVQIRSLAEALSEDGTLLQKYLGRFARADENGFSALNTAFFADGAFIYVPRGKAVKEAVHLMFVVTTGEAGTAIHPRNLIIAEPDSKLTLIESYVSTVQAAYVTNAIDEFVIGDNATIEHCKFQDESRAAYHVAAQHLHLGRSANVISHSFAFGARLSRNNIRTMLAGEGLDCILNGLYITRDEQLADHHMIVEHAKPNCNSHEYYNGILDDRSKGVFHGRILVQQEAQKTDAKQTNKNLLLSDDATIDTKPQLEIYADDVKCTHGATVGQLNDESIFYLRARGIGIDTARRILIHAFAGEIIDRVRCEPLREELDRLVWDRLEDNPHL
ncbi:MAG TPA: Fe-S cluster assembly protein SufD [Verrucomicrobiae bacterium]|nr:Fe-S cluster assembly protein SufD [Verrucomicrobiae bacterium]